MPGGGRFYSWSGTGYATVAGINSRNGYDDLGTRGWWWTSSTTGTSNTFWYGLNGWYMRYMPYYVRMDGDGLVYFNFNNRVDANIYLINTIFNSSDNRFLDNANSNGDVNANPRIKNEFYMSVRCIKNK